MPTYTFVHENTGEVQEHYLRMSELDDFKANNPELKQKLTITNIVGGLSTDSGKLPEGFKDRLREMKKKHPGATGISHLI